MPLSGEFPQGTLNSGGIDRQQDINNIQSTSNVSTASVLAAGVQTIAESSRVAESATVPSVVSALSQLIKTGGTGVKEVAANGLAKLVRERSQYCESALKCLVAMSFDSNEAVRIPALLALDRLPGDDIFIQQDLGRLFSAFGEDKQPPDCENWLMVLTQNLNSLNPEVRRATANCLQRIAFSINNETLGRLFSIADHGLNSNYQDVKNSSVDLMARLIRGAQTSEQSERLMARVSRMFEDDVPGEDVAVARLLKELCGFPQHHEMALALFEDLVFLAEDQHTPFVVEQLAELTYGVNAEIHGIASTVLHTLANHRTGSIRAAALGAIETMTFHPNHEVRVFGMNHLKQILLNKPKEQTLEHACDLLSRLVQSQDTQIQETALVMLHETIDLNS